MRRSCEGPGVPTLAKIVLRGSRSCCSPDPLATLRGGPVEPREGEERRGYGAGYGRRVKEKSGGKSGGGKG